MEQKKNKFLVCNYSRYRSFYHNILLLNRNHTLAVKRVLIWWMWSISDSFTVISEMMSYFMTQFFCYDLLMIFCFATFYSRCYWTLNSSFNGYMLYILYVSKKKLKNKEINENSQKAPFKLYMEYIPLIC